MMKITLVLICMVISFVATNMYSETEPPININAVAGVYGNQAPEIINDYNQAMAKDKFIALHAIDTLSNKHAYSVLALLLPAVELEKKSTIIDALRKADGRDRVVVKFLAAELAIQNSSVLAEGGEELASRHVIKRKLIQILARQIGVDATSVNINSQKDVNGFLKKASNYLSAN